MDNKVSKYMLIVLTVLCTVLIVVSSIQNGAVDPLRNAVGYVLVPVLSAAFFREKLTVSRLVGIGCIVLGMVIFYL